MNWPKVAVGLLAVIYLFILSACGDRSRMGMVRDERTGLQFGSVIEKSVVVDSSQFANNKIKVRIRNTSGDPAFDMYNFRVQLEDAYRNNGYSPTRSNDFGIMLDINVVYSGQITRDRAMQYAFLGAALGAAGGYAANTRGGTGLGAATGATLGSILGSYDRDETFIVISSVTIAVMEPKTGERKTTIVFGGNVKKEKSEKAGFRPFRMRDKVGIAVFAGGKNIAQSAIADGVRQRYLRILTDIL